MILHTDLSKYGFLQLKKDREELISQINELQSLLDDFNFVYPFYKNLYEPEILTKNESTDGGIDVCIADDWLRKYCLIRNWLGIPRDYL